MGTAAPADFELSNCLDAVKFGVVEKCREALMTFRPKRHSNTCDMVRIALGLFKRSGLKAIKTDKDGGSAVTTGEELTEERKKTVQSIHYKQVAVTLDFEEAYLDAYRCVRQRLADKFPSSHRGPLMKNLTRDCRLLGSRGFFSKLLFTVKTHKGSGEVCTRNVHSSVDNPFKPLMGLSSKLFVTKHNI